jgi:hypothetical protein
VDIPESIVMLRRCAEASGATPKHHPVRQATDFAPRTARNDNHDQVVEITLTGNCDTGFDFEKNLGLPG